VRKICLKSLEDIKIVFMLENVHQHDAEEEEQNSRLFKKIPTSWARLSEPGQMDQIMLIKAEIHTLSNDLRRNL
jgi:hypothetical protein